MIDLAISAIFPPLLVIFLIYRNDLYEKEPHDLIIKTFLLGCFSVIPMILLEIITTAFIKNTFLLSLFGIALVEEGVKYVSLYFYNYKNKDFNEPYDGIIYSVSLTMGFALVENLMYVFGSPDGEVISVSRMLTAIPLHACCGIIMGYYLGKSKMQTNNNLNFALALILPVIIHCFYNYFIFIDIFILTLVVLAIAIYYSIKAIKEHQQNSPFKDS